MPPKCRFTREQIIQVALELTAEKGIGALTARSLAQRLGSSAKPIFGLFTNMEEVQQEVLKAADQRYQAYLQEDMSAGQYPPYKASGMAYIRFAREERELFRLLFMRDRSHETIGSQDEEIRPLLALIQKNVGIGEAEARQLHLELWVFVHGIATMLATSYLDWPDAFVSDMLTELYRDMTQRYTKKEEV